MDVGHYILSCGLIACFRVRAWNMLVWNLSYAVKQWLWLIALYALYIWCYL